MEDSTNFSWTTLVAEYKVFSLGPQANSLPRITSVTSFLVLSIWIGFHNEMFSPVNVLKFAREVESTCYLFICNNIEEQKSTDQAITRLTFLYILDCKNVETWKAWFKNDDTQWLHGKCFHNNTVCAFLLSLFVKIFVYGNSCLGKFRRLVSFITCNFDDHVITYMCTHKAVRSHHILPTLFKVKDFGNRMKCKMKYEWSYLIKFPEGSSFFPTLTGQYHGICPWKNALHDTQSQLPAFKLHSESNWSCSNNFKRKQTFCMDGIKIGKYEPFMSVLL